MRYVIHRSALLLLASIVPGIIATSAVSSEELKFTVKHVYEPSKYKDIRNADVAVQNKPYEESKETVAIILERNWTGKSPITRELTRIPIAGTNTGKPIGSIALPPGSELLPYFSSPSDGLVLASPMTGFIIIDYEQDDDPIFDNYPLMVVSPENKIIKRLWTPVTEIGHQYWVGWIGEKEICVAYAAHDPAGQWKLIIDIYKPSEDLDGWEKKSRAYNLGKKYEVTTGVFVKDNKTLYVFGAYYDIELSEEEGMPKHDGILFKVDLANNKMTSSIVSEGGAAPLSALHLSGSIGYSTGWTDWELRDSPSFKQGDIDSEYTVVMLNENENYSRSFKTSSIGTVHAIPELELILLCFDGDMGVPVEKRKNELAPRIVSLPQAYEVVRPDRRANWIFLDAKTLNIVDNWIINSNISPFKYSPSHQLLIAKTTKYRYFPESLPGVTPKKPLQSKLLFLSIERND